MQARLEVRVRGNRTAQLDVAQLTRTPFVIEHYELPRGATLDFAWPGVSGYLAWHDVVLHDGDMAGDFPRTRLLDLRRRLTFMPAGARASGWSQPVDRGNAFTVLYFNQDWVFDELGTPPSERALAPSIYFHDRALQMTMEKLTQAARAPDEAPRLMVDSLALLAGAELLRAARTRVRPTGALSPTQFDAAKDFVEAHFSSDIALADIAAATGLSAFHFSRAFKQAAGVSPYRYVLKRRVAYAKSLMRDTAMPIADIARAAGFKSPSHFSRTFVDVAGLSPRAYRAQQRA